jgi:hypothetical protein
MTAVEQAKQAYEKVQEADPAERDWLKLAWFDLFARALLGSLEGEDERATGPDEYVGLC